MMLTAKIDNAAASGNTTIVAAQTGKIIRVHAYNIVAAGSVVAKFQSGAGGTDLTGPMSMIVGVSIPAAMQPDDIEPDACLFQTAAGSLLNLNASGAVQISGHITYSICPST